MDLFSDKKLAFIQSNKPFRTCITVPFSCNPFFTWVIFFASCMQLSCCVCIFDSVMDLFCHNHDAAAAASWLSCAPASPGPTVAGSIATRLPTRWPSSAVAASTSPSPSRPPVDACCCQRPHITDVFHLIEACTWSKYMIRESSTNPCFLYEHWKSVLASWGESIFQEACTCFP